MDAVLESLVNVQKDIQQIRSGISLLRYQSRSTEDPTVRKHLQALSDTSWEKTYNGLHSLQQALGTAQQNNPIDESIVSLVQTSSQIDENIEQVFTEIRTIQENMYNLRLRDPVKGRGSLKSATEEYADLARVLDRLYINPLDERALHYSMKLHGRLEDTLNSRQSPMDPGYGKWINSPESELGRSRVNVAPTGDIGGQTQSPSMTMNAPSQFEQNFMQMTDDPNILAEMIKFLTEMTTVSTPGRGETKQAIHYFLSMLEEKRDNPTTTPEQPQEGYPSQGLNLQTNVVQTGNNQAQANVAEPSVSDILAAAGDPTTDWQTQVLPHLERLLNLENTGRTASSLQKLTKIADIFDNIDSDLAKLLREYIEEEEDCLPEFPSTSSIIKEQVVARRKITEKKAGAVALGT